MFLKLGFRKLNKPRMSSEWPNSLGAKYKDHTFWEGLERPALEPQDRQMPAAFDSSTGGVPDGMAAGAGSSSGTGTQALLGLIRIATFALDADGRIVLWSPTAADLARRPVEQVLGTDVADLFPAEARSRAGEVFRRASRTGGWVGFLPMLRGDGAVFDVGFRAVTLRLSDGHDLIQVVATDAGDLRRFEFERTLFEALFDQVPVGIAIYDTERRYIGVNNALAAYNGIAAREHLGHRVEDLVPDTARTVPPLQKRVLETGEPVVDVLVRATTRAGGPDERRYWSVSYARLQDRDGQVLGLTAIVVDVTERQNAVERARLARRRAAILNAANNRIGTSLDVTQTAAELVSVTVPMFCDQATVYLLDSATTSRNTAPNRASVDVSTEPISLHSIATRASNKPDASALVDHVGDSLPPIQPSTALYECITGGRARLLDINDATHVDYADIGHADASHADRSIVAPLVARGCLIGAVRFVRVANRDEFALIDLETADELAARTAVSMDNARLYVRERDTALMLQRTLLPQRFPDVEGTRVAFRYRPGSVGAQVGGDWFDVFALPCRRVAFVVGDVMGSGLQAAGIMGQFRTAARTLAQLDLNPALVLRELDELARSMSESHIATCVYAIYDPVVGECTVASAGHPPPLLAIPGVGVEPVPLAPGAPLGVGGQRFEEREFMVEPASALAFYTDGLVEDRGRDIEAGIDELLGTISKAVPSPTPLPKSGAGSEPGSEPGGENGAWLEAACDAAFESLLGPHPFDDATLLIAELDRFPENRVASWVLTSQPTVAARARELVRRRLEVWRPDVADVVELLVSELVTNALRYGRGPIGLRLLHGATTVVCEVSDELDAAPRLRTVHQGDEGGRGLYLVDQLSANWGTRTTAHGKIVWFEV